MEFVLFLNNFYIVYNIIKNKALLQMVEFDYFDKVFLQEVDGFGIALKEKDFRWANILANRIMSNSYIFENKDCAIVGHVFKEVATDGLGVQQKNPNSSLIADYANFSTKIVGGVIKMIEQKKFDLDQLWVLYHTQQNATNKMFQSKIEKMVYLNPDSEFSSIFIKNLLSLLESNLPLFADPKSNLVKGFLNETGRISKVHGLSFNDEHFVSLFRALDRIDDYNKVIFQGVSYTKNAQEETVPLAKKIFEIFKTRREDSFHTEIDNLLWKMIKIWRLDFIKYLEVQTRTFSVRDEKLITDEEEDSELINEVKKQIEKELGS